MAFRTNGPRLQPVSGHLPTYVQIPSVSSKYPWSLEGNGFGKKKNVCPKEPTPMKEQVRRHKATSLIPGGSGLQKLGNSLDNTGIQ